MVNKSTNSSTIGQGSSEDIGRLFRDEGGVDIDARYQREETLDIGDGGERSRDIFTMLSSELNGEDYKIRTPKQQSDWAEKKSLCQKHLGRHLLKLNSVANALIEKCDGKTKHLLGVIIKEPDGNPPVDYSRGWTDQVKELMTRYMAGDKQYTLDELSTLIVDDYNLSYCHFTQVQAERVITEFDGLKASDMAPLPPSEGDVLTLFPEVTPAIKKYEEEQGLSWAEIEGIVRNCRLFFTRIKELRNRLVSTNMRSCISSAMNYFYQCGGIKQTGMNHMDLISEGAEGLMHAADMYIWGIDVKFTTYADYWIKLKVSRYVKNNNPIRIPIHATDMVNTILRVFREFVKKNGEDHIPSREFTTKAVDGAISDAIWKLALYRYQNIPVNISCVNTEGGEDSVSFDIFSEVINENEDHVTKAEASLMFRTAKKLLTPHQYKLLQLKFTHDKSHKEIAEELGGHHTAKSVRVESKRILDRLRRELGEDRG
jgi:RNA polymerase sporulation-specific sigma factor